jgi:hypothetical protein
MTYYFKIYLKPRDSALNHGTRENTLIEKLNLIEMT